MYEYDEYKKVESQQISILNIDGIQNILNTIIAR